ncbi:MAG: 50S ribosomal protein L17 [Candidatus Melainabacteria bacterium LEY3_CP_29_8]|nr:MAG: 50S ribosomal protein L17 [Candidatus Melainabacteria bacterium LEY3_CP_29_8]
MRHQAKKHQLSRAQDQRKALLRSLATQLFLHGEIKTTMAKAKALKSYADKVISLAKKGDLNSRRIALRYIYDIKTNRYMDVETKAVVDEKVEGKKLMEETVLRKLFTEISNKYANRNGGYTRIYRMPNRRGDNSEMALIQLS